MFSCDVAAELCFASAAARRNDAQREYSYTQLFPSCGKNARRCSLILPRLIMLREMETAMREEC